jgi:hypothetical protein
MKFEKSPPELVALFDRVAPRDFPAQRRSMFSYPCVFVNGQMFAGLHGPRMVLRLGDVERAAFLSLKGATTFEPMPGRVMREYAVVPPSMLKDEKALAAWILRSQAYAASLPPKDGGKPKSPAKPAAKRAAKGAGASSGVKASTKVAAKKKSPASARRNGK